MRAREFLRESDSATTTAGSVATVATALGAPISRYTVYKPAKYSNTPLAQTTRKKKHAFR